MGGVSSSQFPGECTKGLRTDMHRSPDRGRNMPVIDRAATVRGQRVTLHGLELDMRAVPSCAPGPGRNNVRRTFPAPQVAAWVPANDNCRVHAVPSSMIERARLGSREI